MNNVYQESTREDIINVMRKLKFTGMLESYDEIISDAIRRKEASNYILHNLLKSELTTGGEAI